MSLSSCKKIIKLLCNAVTKLHELNILHMDIKIDNILTNINFDYLSQIQKTINDNKYNEFIETNLQNLYNEKNIDSLNRNQKKKTKRKIKTKVIKQLKLDYINEYNKLNINESSNNLNKKSIYKDSNYKIIKEIKDNNNLLKIYDISDSVNYILTDYSNSILEKEVKSNDEYQIRSQRCPENLLSITYRKNSESWAIGCLFWELLTKKSIFEPNLNQNKLERDREQLSLMEKYLGKINKEITLDCPRTFELYDDNGKIINNKKCNRVELEEELKKIRPDLLDQEIIEICIFLKECWNYDYKNRKKPEQLLKLSIF